MLWYCQFMFKLAPSQFCCYSSSFQTTAMYVMHKIIQLNIKKRITLLLTAIGHSLPLTCLQRSLRTSTVGQAAVRHIIQFISRCAQGQRRLRSDCVTHCRILMEPIKPRSICVEVFQIVGRK